MNFTTLYLSTITAKTLIVHGDRDIFFPVAIPVETYQAIPDAYLWSIPNGDHIPIMTEKHQTYFMEMALDFLQGNWE